MSRFKVSITPKLGEIMHVTVSLQDEEITLGPIGMGDYATMLGPVEWFKSSSFKCLVKDIEDVFENYYKDEMEDPDLWYEGAGDLNRVLMKFLLDWRNYKSKSVYDGVAAVATKAAFAERNNEFKTPNYSIERSE